MNSTEKIPTFCHGPFILDKTSQTHQNLVSQRETGKMQNTVAELVVSNNVVYILLVFCTCVFDFVSL